ncbi:MAG: WbqC family protein [Candidatus Scalindua rubra]|uniref:WbqC-like protein family protein n=1 Tax=Candidatus Scalindua brodae TaxID=237368 RepID=A0A0B0ERP3_9BACT|nr:MAG: WbqC-like protein family protein [Candidatus Scalindua brodae]MBZ0110729.1 WbqC family protein [Candidatus Scalindua rubra]
MLITIHQPQYLPWLGYLDKIDKADVLVILDNVQFKKNEWQNRNRIKTVHGCQWITVPVLYRFPEKINEVKINNKENWRRKHLQALITNYSKSTYFDNYKRFFEDIFSRNWDRLVDINVEIIKFIISALDLKTRLVMASELKLREEPTERLIDICKTLNGNKYLAGKDGDKYMDLELFDKEGIEVIFQDFKHPVYNQLFGDFEPYMSAVDLLFNCGDNSLEILRCN